MMMHPQNSLRQRFVVKALLKPQVLPASRAQLAPAAPCRWLAPTPPHSLGAAAPDVPPGSWWELAGSFLPRFNYKPQQPRACQQLQVKGCYSGKNSAPAAKKPHKTQKYPQSPQECRE